MNIHNAYCAACQAPSDIGALLPTIRKYASLCRHVTEFGIRDGNSTVALLDSESVAVYRGYDIATNDNHNRILEAARALGIDARIMYADTRHLEMIEPTELLFIDSLHVGDQIRAELAYQDRVSLFIAFHDTITFGVHGENPDSEGICAAILEMLEPNGWKLVEELTHCNGLQVWGK